MPLSVAIVGSGPSGFYAAEALLKGGDVAIDLIERLPTPFGLVRGGVAPDHQSTKQVVRAFERTARDKAVAYFGHVEIGRDLSMDELCGLYDAVVLAVGAPADRPLGIPGEELPGVVGSAAFVGWYNGHPDFARVDPPLSTERAVVIGNGNVALDVARVLVKTPQEMAASDIAEEAEAAISAAPLREVVLLGRRGPVEARFTLKELREMGTLAAAAVALDPAQLPAAAPAGLPERKRRLAERNLEILRGLAAAAAARPKRVRFEFYARPVAVLGARRVEGLRWERTELRDGRVVGTGQLHDLPCGLIVPAIGYRSKRIPGVPFDAGRGRLRNRDGRIAEGLYCVGWCKRGPSGVIGSNKQDGDLAAETIRRELGPRVAGGGGKPGRPGLQRLLSARGVRWVDYPAWQAIDAAERAAAAEGAPRRKFVSIDDMLALLDQASPHGS
ncbi:ferredoxin--NADP+ reductase [Tistlia consotensis]|uniref:Ferredoxin--NADP+ reductase n=1 Tax=Tistlia consotensis USBA 355 TaxID=560819 RepID=A0A1Y6BS99_9PROT|nr:FAD-dependent oxidoreductase [Tistlia consotensis]SMF17302.1 ferredoxin--NADP+ reductase [Tistlia consotensis USBA 355]SNR40541.1 ferredoxin--NADP+ reductase [Tistlia consotensis]